MLYIEVYRGVLEASEQVEVLQFEQVFLGERQCVGDVHARRRRCQRVATVRRHGRQEPASPLPLVEAPRPVGDRAASRQLGLVEASKARFLTTHRHTGTHIASLGQLIAKFHYTDTDTDTDPNGPARTQRSFAAKKSVSVSVSGPCSGI